MENLLNSQEVANLLGMSKVWVYKAAESGLLPFYRVGDAIPVRSSRNPGIS